MSGEVEYPPGVVGTLCVDWLWTAAADAFRKLQLPPGSRHPFIGGHAGIAKKRQAVVRRFLEDERFQWLCFLDSDQVPPRKTILRLLDHEVPIVSALIFARVPPHHPCCGYVSEGGHQPLAEVDPSAGLTKVDYAGAGCLLVRREVFEAVEPPWFKAITPSGGGEDAFFCRKAREAGFPIYVDQGLNVPHVGATSVDTDYVRTWFQTDAARRGMEGYDREKGWRY